MIVASRVQRAHGRMHQDMIENHPGTIRRVADHFVSIPEWPRRLEPFPCYGKVARILFAFPSVRASTLDVVAITDLMDLHTILNQAAAR